MATSLAAHMQRLRDGGRKAFIPFLTAGFPDAATFARLLRCTGAADVVEVGLPFSDPVADGPSICHASEVALRQGMHAARLFEILAATPDRPPTLVMTYLNPVLAYGVERFGRDARACGVAGLILTDLPPEDGDEVLACMAAAGLAAVLLVSPTTPTPRIAAIAARATGFLYCVAVRGTTGARAQVGADAAPTVARARSVTSLPVVVGFGISTPEQVRSTCGYADGVVVGSALVDLVRQHQGGADLVSRFTAHHDALAAAAHAPPPAGA